jgi:hypothetical protein
MASRLARGAKVLDELLVGETGEEMRGELSEFRQ